MTEIKADINYKGLKKLIKEITKEYKIKVGLLSGHGGDDEVSDDLDLAGLGAIMEYGATIPVTDKMRKYLASQGLYLKDSTKEIHIPARSFLQMPLEQKANEILKNTKADYSIQDINYFLDKGKLTLINFAVVLGAECVNAILDAFETGGFGQWAENHPFTIQQKGSSSPLIDTGALRQKITAEITSADGTLYVGNKK
jgi:hypothetical protein